MNGQVCFPERILPPPRPPLRTSMCSLLSPSSRSYLMVDREGTFVCMSLYHMATGALAGKGAVLVHGPVVLDVAFSEPAKINATVSFAPFFSPSLSLSFSSL